MAILTASDKIQATVEFITGVKDGQFGQYRSVLFMRCDRPGETDEAKVWRSFQPHEVNVFRKGQRVHLIPTERKGKATWDVEIIDGQQQPTTQQPSTEKRKAEMEQYISKMTRLYSHCYGSALAAMADCPESAIQACASSAFIAVQKKFGLT